MSPLLKAVWAPVVLALTVTLTFFNSYPTFDFKLFFCCLFVAAGHFYATHLAGASYFAVHNRSKENYWKVVSISYIPLILSFWVCFLLTGPIQFAIDLSVLGSIVLGTLLSFILFALLIIKKVKMDLDAVLALILIIGIVGTLSIGLFAWIIITVTGLP